MTPEQQILWMARIMSTPWVESYARGSGWDEADSHVYAPTPDWAMDKAARLFASGCRIVHIAGGDQGGT